jgi:predicted nucleic acid-binding protein
MANFRYVYWDANPFCIVLNNESERLEACLAVLRAAESGELKIVTSALTLAEVVRTKDARISPGKEAVLSDFFQNDFLVFVSVEWFVGNRARQLMHQHPALKPMDALHVATAIRAKVSEMHTYDRKLIRLSGKVGVPPLTICPPSVPDPTLQFPS